ncbi:MAG: hypothetical protein U5R49_01360 [Deltaproteobacteria bacterium]|nr:hypothetical protein [Deltaproteobacteria bacterium]
MPAKKKPRKGSKKKKASDRAALSETERLLVTSLLENIDGSDPSEIVDQIPHPRAAKALVESLPLDHPSIVDLLGRLKARFDEKSVQKAIKRILFKLKGRGVAVEGLYDTDDPAPITFKPADSAPPQAYVGVLDSMGNRAVMFSLTPKTGGVEFGLGVVSDEKGIQEFLFGKMSKKRAKELRQQFSAGSTLVETSLPHFTSVLEEAYQASLVLGNEVPQDYLELRAWLSAHESPPDGPPTYDLVGGTVATDDPLTDSEINDLLDHPLMADWIIELGSLRPFMEAIIDSEDSPLILSAEQKAQRAIEIKQRCATELFPSEKRRLLKSRMEEMAFIFHKMEEGSPLVPVCLKVAASMDEEDSDFRKNRFLFRLVDQSMTRYFDIAREDSEGDEKKEDHASSPILIS